MKSCVLLVLLFVVLNLVECQHNNVCKSFADYYTDTDNNPNCYYNPDYNLTVPEIIERHQYPVETYHVTTIDGYILTIFRIPYGKNSIDEKPGPPVFLQHGINLNCACFLDRGPKSLGFILADEGYDVWLGNFRGNLYSRNNVNLTSSSKNFWDYSFNEHGRYDLPAQLDLVSSINNQKIIYIGFSMGTTSAYIYGVTYPDIAYEKIKIFISLAPIAFLKDIKTVVKFLVPLWGLFEPVLQAITNGRIAIRNPTLTQALCLPFPFQMKLCEFVSYILFGFDYEQNDPETLPITLFQNSDDISVKTVSHYVQFIKTGLFQNFDYGPKDNLKNYRSPIPPLYDLSKMRVPNYLMRGPNDLLGTKENVEKLYALLPAAAKPYPIDVIKHEKFSHSDFLDARDVKLFCYDQVVNIIRNITLA